MKKNDLPSNLAIFPLSNFIIFPKTSVPLNIFEPRYIDMINDSIKSDKLIGMVQPKIMDRENQNNPELHKIGCMGKIIKLLNGKIGIFFGSSSFFIILKIYIISIINLY